MADADPLAPPSSGLSPDAPLRRNMPTMVIPPELRKPAYPPGYMPKEGEDYRLFGPMIDYMQKEYERLGIGPNGRFILHDDNGNPIVYRRLTPEELGPEYPEYGPDWDFMKVGPPMPEMM